MKGIELELEGLDCAGCASKIEQLTNDLEGIESASLNFVTKKLKIDISNEEDKKQIIDTIREIVERLEPGVKVIDKSMSERIVLTDDQGPGHDHGDHLGHHHDHGDVGKKDLIKILLAGVLFALGFILKLEGQIRLIVFLAAYLIVGYEIILIAIRNVRAGMPFDENFLMTVATIGAFIIGEYPEGVAVMLFYQVGEYFQGIAVNNSRRSIESLMDIRPDSANLLRDGQEVVVDPADVHIGDYIIIKPGEKVPLDGLVVEGESTMDTSNITGESVPRNVKVGDEIYSGVVNNQGLLKVQVKKEFGESTVSKILDLVENASSKKAPMENFITKFARYYTPVVVYIALAIGLLPPIFFNGDLKEWAYKAFVFLVMSCPCALVISIPLGFFGGIGASSRKGVLIKGGNYLEALNDLETIVFDKTGTITKGSFKVTEVLSYGDYSREEILELAAYGESYSTHPIGRSIMEAYGKEIKKNYVSNYQEISGKGIQVDINGESILLGNQTLLEDKQISLEKAESIGTVVYLAKDRKHIGTIIVSDELKPGIAEDIKKLKSLGIKELVMLSGDNEDIARAVGEIAGLDQVYGDLLPHNKVEQLEKIMEGKTSGKQVAFVGDGVNDAPVIARADIGIAMGGLGSDAAIEAADIVIMTDEISKISTGMKVAKNTKKIVSQNIAIAISVKLIVLVLGIFGAATMWQAVFADVGVSIIAILNAIRTLRVED